MDGKGKLLGRIELGGSPGGGDEQDGIRLADTLFGPLGE
jgi:hypothetical protein